MLAPGPDPSPAVLTDAASGRATDDADVGVTRAGVTHPGSGATASHAAASEVDNLEVPPIDRTVKLYIGGKQVRPDSGYSFECRSSKGGLLGEVPLGNRKDIRNAVEAAGRAQQWGSATAHNRAQVLYYLAEIFRSARERSSLAWRQSWVGGRRQGN